MGNNISIRITKKSNNECVVCRDFGSRSWSCSVGDHKQYINGSLVGQPSEEYLVEVSDDYDETTNQYLVETVSIRFELVDGRVIETICPNDSEINQDFICGLDDKIIGENCSGKIILENSQHWFFFGHRNWKIEECDHYVKDIYVNGQYIDEIVTYTGNDLNPFILKKTQSVVKEALNGVSYTEEGCLLGEYPVGSLVDENGLVKTQSEVLREKLQLELNRENSTLEYTKRRISELTEKLNTL